MVKVLNLIQGSQEWLDFRSQHIGASDAATIMGLNPWSSPKKLWEEKLGLKTVHVNSAMQRGNDLEPIARKKLSQLSRETLSACVIKSDKHDWMIASLDAANGDISYIAEIKCPGQKNHDIAKDGNIPSHYYPQLQHQMYCAELKSMQYYSFDGENGVLIDVLRDDVFIERMIEMESQFYNCMITFTEPTNNINSIKIDCEEWDNLSRKYLENKEAECKLRSDNEKIKNRLVELCDGNSAHGEIACLAVTNRKGSIKYSDIPDLQFVDLEQYREKSTSCVKISKR